MKQLRLKKKKKLVIVARTKALSAKMGDDTRKLSHERHRCHASSRPGSQRPRPGPHPRSRAPGAPRRRARRLGARGVRRARGRDRAARGRRHLSPPRPPRPAADPAPQPRRLNRDFRAKRSERGRPGRRPRRDIGRGCSHRPRPADDDDAERDAYPLPISRACFACGTDNELGLRARLEFDADSVRGAWQPRAPFRRPDGSLAPVALTTLLDEAAFWLGALATGESGMTTELRVSLHEPAPFEAPVTVSGRRAAVRPRREDPRYQETEIVARAGGHVVATARITFVVVRGAARRLVGGMLAINDPACVRRVFPAYTR